jgi:Zn-dependent oligopeptidase
MMISIVASSMRVDVFTAVKAFADTPEYGALYADGQSKRFVDRLLRDYRRSGLDLPAAQRERMLALQTELTKLCQDFSKNVDDDKTKAEWTRQQLDGMSDKDVSSYKKTEDGKYIVSLQYPDYFPLMKTCRVEDTRKAMQLLFESR